jgi:hypothetical protein
MISILHYGFKDVTLVDSSKLFCKRAFLSMVWISSPFQTFPAMTRVISKCSYRNFNTNMQQECNHQGWYHMKKRCTPLDTLMMSNHMNKKMHYSTSTNTLMIKSHAEKMHVSSSPSSLCAIFWLTEIDLHTYFSTSIRRIGGKKICLCGN